MTVASTPTVAGPFTGTGAIATLPFAFKCFVASDLIVQSGGITLNYGGDYTATLNADQEGSPGGTVTVSAAANALGVLVYIGLNMALSQPSSFPSQSKWSPTAVEKAFDRITLLIKQLTALGYSAVVAPLGESLGILPPKTVRAGTYFVFDANGDPATASGTGNDTALRTDIAASSGGGLVGTIRPELGAVARTVQSRLRDVAHSLDFGLAGDGSDEGVKLTNFFNSMKANPGVIHRAERKIFCTTIVLPDLNVSGIHFEAVEGASHDTGALLNGFVIKWTGTTNAGFITRVTSSPGAGNQFLTGVILKGMSFDCNSLIGTGIRIESVRNCEFMLAGANATTTLFDLGVMSGVLGEARDLQDNLIRLYGRQIEAPSGVCLQLGGDSTANTSFNEIYCDFEHSNAPAVICTNSDNNDWFRFRSSCSGSATESIRLLGNAAAGQLARDEIFHHFSANRAPKVYGTADYANPSYGHKFLAYDWDNSTPAPVIGLGAWASCEMPQSFTPTVTGAGGTGLTTGTIIGSYTRMNGYVDVQMSVSVTAGTGYTSLTFTLPYASIGSIGETAIPVGVASTNKSFNAYNAPGTSNLVIHSPDGSTALPLDTYAVSFRYRVR